MSTPAPQQQAKKLPICWVCNQEVATSIDNTLNAHVCYECGTRCNIAGRHLTEAGIPLSTQELQTSGD